MLGLGGGVPAGSDDVACVAQHVRQRLLGAREAPRHGDLGAVEDDIVGQTERRTHQTERHRRVEHHEIGADGAGHGIDPAHHPRVRQQYRLAGAFDVERLQRVERCRPFVGRREDGERVGR